MTIMGFLLWRRSVAKPQIIAAGTLTALKRVTAKPTSITVPCMLSIRSWIRVPTGPNAMLKGITASTQLARLVFSDPVCACWWASVSLAWLSLRLVALTWKRRARALCLLVSLPFESGKFFLLPLLFSFFLFLRLWFFLFFSFLSSGVTQVTAFFLQQDKESYFYSFMLWRACLFRAR